MFVPARAGWPAARRTPAADRSSGHGSGTAQHGRDPPVVRCQELDLLCELSYLLNSTWLRSRSFLRFGSRIAPGWFSLKTATGTCSQGSALSKRRDLDPEHFGGARRRGTRGRHAIDDSPSILAGQSLCVDPGILLSSQVIVRVGHS